MISLLNILTAGIFAVIKNTIPIKGLLFLAVVIAVLTVSLKTGFGTTHFIGVLLVFGIQHFLKPYYDKQLRLYEEQAQLEAQQHVSKILSI